MISETQGEWKEGKRRMCVYMAIFKVYLIYGTRPKEYVYMTVTNLYIYSIEADRQMTPTNYMKFDLDNWPLVLVKSESVE